MDHNVHLERRIRRLEDRAEIDDLLTRYAIACDLRDLDALGDCFDVDGTFGAGPDEVVGRAAVVEALTDRLRAWGPTVHAPQAVTVRFDDEDDRRADGTVIARTEIMLDGSTVVVAHHYADEYVKGSDGRWRLLSRVSAAIYSMPLGELATADWRQPRLRWPGTTPSPAPLPESAATWSASRG